MKTNMRQLIDAVPALNKLISSDMPLKTAYRVTLMMDKLEPELKFFNQKRSEIPQGEDAVTYMEALLELTLETEVEPLEIPLSDNLTLSPMDVRNLRPFAHFIDEGKAQDRQEAKNG